MKILFITHYFQPEPNLFFGLPFAKELVRRGHQVEVLTGFPNYPGGKIYRGYRVKLIQKESMDGVTVYRFPLYPSHDRSSLKRIICYSSLSIAMALIAPLIIRRVDVAYVVQGPATLGLPAVILKWLRRIPFVYNIQDLWPDSLLSTGMFENSIGSRVVHAWCDFVYRRAASITLISNGMKDRLLQRGVPAAKMEVVHNWCDEALVCDEDAKQTLASVPSLAGKFNIIFAGNMGKAQALDAVIQAAAMIQADCLDVRFIFIGSGVDVERLKNLAIDLKLDNVLFLPRRPVSEIGAFLRLADALLVHLRKDPLFSITIPSKTQAYLAIGRPILVGVSGDAADMVKRASAGLCCESENPESIAAAVRQMRRLSVGERAKMGQSGAEYYQKYLSFANAVSHYEKVFTQVLQGSR
ncbi:MAG: glycosyltransferase family 4 protein [Candidatus Accumulibacter propinquus]|jgi:colanic acid biosynthesis glycosyl transferase WcaI